MDSREWLVFEGKIKHRLNTIIRSLRDPPNDNQYIDTCKHNKKLGLIEALEWVLKQDAKESEE